MRTNPLRGEVWFADLGLAEKSRPVLILSYPDDDDARALVIVAPLTSQIRNKRGEVDLGKPKWLPKHSAVNLQGLASFDLHKLTRLMGRLPAEKMVQIDQSLKDILGLS